MTQSATKTILKAGFIAGLLDIIAASIQYMIVREQEPTPIFRFIASGVFGKEAMTGGWPMAFAGLLFHFVIAYIFTLFFFLIYPRLGLHKMNKVVVGLLYGLFVWVIMNRVVLPLSNTPAKFPFRLVPALKGMAILMVCVGLPIALIIGKYYERKSLSHKVNKSLETH